MAELPRPRLRLPAISGDAGIRDLVQTMKEPAYLRLLGKCLGAGAGAAVVARRLPPQMAMPVAMLAGIYVGLEFAAWMEDEAQKQHGPVVDVTPVSVPAIEDEVHDG